MRAALAAVTSTRAARLLGRPYRCVAAWCRASSWVADLGFPTANMPLRRKRRRSPGIFAVRVHGIDGVPTRAGVASLGTRPTVDGTEPLLEAHVFDFGGDLYGREIEVEFVAKLREEVRFASLDDAGGADASGCRAGAPHPSGVTE